MAHGLAKLATLALGFGLTGSLAQSETTYRGYESPPYTVERTFGAAELRAYAPHILAEVTVQGDQSSALGRGFQVLAGYIFGGNAAQGQVAMTSPVTQGPPESIAMTSPVTQEGAGQLWTVSFMMPRSYTLATLPTPRDAAIRFVQTEPEQRLTLQFSGRTPERTLVARADELRAIAAANGLTITAGPFYQFYDDPFTLPWNRRNEVAFRVE